MMLKVLFGQPANYDEMLRKIAAFTFIVTAAYTVLFAVFSSPAQAVLLRIGPPVDMDIYGVKLRTVPILLLLPPIIVTLVFRMARMHNQVSQLLRIRSRYDIHDILVPLAEGAGAKLSASQLRRLRDEQLRREAMNSVFYRYASSRNPLIDSQLIITALDKWTSYWIWCEATMVAALATLVAALCGTLALAFWCAMSAVGFTLFGALQLRQCRKATRDELAAILERQDWKQQIVEWAHALPG